MKERVDAVPALSVKAILRSAKKYTLVRFVQKIAVQRVLTLRKSAKWFAIGVTHETRRGVTALALNGRTRSAICRHGNRDLSRYADAR